MNVRMKHVILFGISFLLAILMFFVLKKDNSLFLISLPFELLGNVLRWLSLHSTIGNIVACIIYGLFSLMPCIYLIIIKRRPSSSGMNYHDILLPILSIYSFYMLYQLINPSLMLSRLPKFIDSSFIPYLTLSLSILYLCILVGYIILKLTVILPSKIPTKDKTLHLYQILGRILLFTSGFYTCYIGYHSTFVVMKHIQELDNISIIKLGFIIISYILETLPLLFTILLLIKGYQLLQVLSIKQMEDEILAMVEVSLMAKYTVYVTIISNIALNFIQFLLYRHLSNANYELHISILPLAISFSTIILSGYFKKAKELHEENEMFI